MVKTFTHYTCVGCGLPMSNNGLGATAHLRGARHHAGVMRNVLLKLTEQVPNGCMHVGPYLVESAREAIRNVSPLLDSTNLGARA